MSMTLVQIGNSSKIERDFINEGSKQDLKRQKLRDCGEAYIPRKRIAKSVISSPTEVGKIIVHLRN